MFADKVTEEELVDEADTQSSHRAEPERRADHPPHTPGLFVHHVLGDKPHDRLGEPESANHRANLNYAEYQEVGAEFPRGEHARQQAVGYDAYRSHANLPP